MAQQVQGQFGYQKVQLIKTNPLGIGSYGAVYKAMCDHLPCAGKILHPTLFQFNEPGAMTLMRRFEQECSYLSAIRHPNIVQYLGLHQDPETQLPVLLMELMDDNLTHFLQQSQDSLPYHTQANICYDIALALVYLHSNGIIHRDLSSNNILLIGAGNRAKVSDFGMAKLLDTNCTTMTRLTMCPGTLPYMPPEALDDPPVYTDKLDSFSFGVLNIQIITRQFPNPGCRTMKVEDPRSPTGIIEMPILEIERRKSHIKLINPTHPLLTIATDCLSYNQKDRPSAKELCYCLATLKEASQYCDRVQETQERSRLLQSTTADRENGERQLREQHQENKQLQQHREKCDEQTVCVAKHQQATDCVIEARKRQLQGLSKQLVASEQVPAQFQQDGLQRDKWDQKMHGRDEYLRQELKKEDRVLQQSMVTVKTKLTLSWKTCHTSPNKMYRGSATVCGSIAYFRPAASRQVLSYDSTKEEWSAFPECPTYNFTLVVVNSIVTAVGGEQSDNYTKTLLSLMEESGKRRWVEHFPPMPTPRELTAAVCNEKSLVVAGGEIDWAAELTTVEVMDLDIPTWSTASSLPHPLSYASATLCAGNVYLVGGWDQRGDTKSVLTCSLSALVQSQTTVANTDHPANYPVWHMIADLPVTRSTCVTQNGQLMALGGYNLDGKNTNNIYMYNTETNSWEVISHMSTPRCRCLVTVLPGCEIIVVGGQTNTGETDTVEIATLQ